eukprot:330594-Chlamydomonas_euryale.AAC.5
MHMPHALPPCTCPMHICSLLQAPCMRFHPGAWWRSACTCRCIGGAAAPTPVQAPAPTLPPPASGSGSARSCAAASRRLPPTCQPYRPHPRRRTTPARAAASPRPSPPTPAERRGRAVAWCTGGTQRRTQACPEGGLLGGRQIGEPLEAGAPVVGEMGDGIQTIPNGAGLRAGRRRAAAAAGSRTCKGPKPNV